MAKRSIEGYRPIGLSRALAQSHRYVPKATIKKLFEAMGPIPPKRRFEQALLFPKSGNYVTRQISARAQFILSVERAAAEYMLETEARTRPTATQMASEFATIENAARKLLLALKAGEDGDLDKGPYALRYEGLQAWAADEHDRDQEIKFLPQEPVAVTRVRVAIRGVAAIRQWARYARDRKQRTVSEQKKREAGTKPSRYDGNAPLNTFLKRVFADCWWAIAGRQTTDAPKTIAFCKLAARAVGVCLSDNAARERVRSIRGPTGKSKQKAF